MDDDTEQRGIDVSTQKMKEIREIVYLCSGKYGYDEGAVERLVHSIQIRPSWTDGSSKFNDMCVENNSVAGEFKIVLSTSTPFVAVHGFINCDMVPNKAWIVYAEDDFGLMTHLAKEKYDHEILLRFVEFFKFKFHSILVKYT